MSWRPLLLLGMSVAASAAGAQSPLQFEVRPLAWPRFAEPIGEAGPLGSGAAGIGGGGAALSWGEGTSLDLGRGVAMIESDSEIRLSVSADVLFDFDKWNIRPDAQAALAQVAQTLREKARPGRVIRVEGHTDAKGSDAYNQRLSERRAASVKAWLIEREGLRQQGYQWVTKGFGESRPVAPNETPDGRDNPEGRQRNRRVELVFAK